MILYKHSVVSDGEKCTGCTHCLRHCPTEAIRIRGGKAVIDSARCIDCSECIRVCPHKAKSADFDALAELDFANDYIIALPDPTLYGQFPQLRDVDALPGALLSVGFSDVYEVAKAAELHTEYTRLYLQQPTVARPVLSSNCPVIVRLISLRFPLLRDRLLPLAPPMELAAKFARERALFAHPDLDPARVKTAFISPCPARVSWVKNTPEGKVQDIDYVLSVRELFFRLRPLLTGTEDRPSEVGKIGLGWAASHGEASALMNDCYLAADGIENVTRVLDNIETGSMPDLEFVELRACHAGCVGGLLNVENPYIARVRLNTLRRLLPVSRNRLPREAYGTAQVPQELLTMWPMDFSTADVLAGDRKSRLEMMAKINRIAATLPGRDCGGCGAPNCRAFAQDVARGEAKASDCVVFMKERLERLLTGEGSGIGAQGTGESDDGI
ncbi:MAG: 4Fe-4S dicluster domain-containing protein [Clostridiales bacterium]|nr:4Fe-4S dicluster domain-containing protein [Clostridiales bacterium]